VLRLLALSGVLRLLALSGVLRLLTLSGVPRRRRCSVFRACRASIARDDSRRGGCLRGPDGRPRGAPPARCD